MKIALILLIIIAVMPLVNAIDFNTTISAEDKATFDKILEPVMKIYNLTKYAATAIAVLILLIAAIGLMTSGSDPKKKDSSKQMMTYVILGLIVIWAAPFVVNFILG